MRLLFLPFLLSITCIAASREWREPLDPENILRARDPPKAPGKRQPLPELYRRRYSEVTFVGTHNSAAVRTKENGWSISGRRVFVVLLLLLAAGFVWYFV